VSTLYFNFNSDRGLRDGNSQRTYHIYLIRLFRKENSPKFVFYKLLKQYNLTLRAINYNITLFYHDIK